MLSRLAVMVWEQFTLLDIGGWFCNSVFMQTVSLKEAQKNLPELVHNLATRGDLLILEGDRPVARLVLVEYASAQGFAELAASLQGTGRKYLRPGADSIRDLISEREEEEKGRSGATFSDGQLLANSAQSFAPSREPIRRAE